VQYKCDITAQMLYGQPSFPAVLKIFLEWVSNEVEDVNTCYNLYNEFTFDFPILLAELNRRGILFNHIHLLFADMHFDCQEINKG